jgi:hypothetical protein
LPCRVAPLSLLVCPSAYVPQRKRGPPSSVIPAALLVNLCKQPLSS